MPSLIWTAKRYDVRPSEIAGIVDPWIAFQFDETAAILTDRCTDKNGTIDFSRLTKHEPENEFLRFAQKFGREV